MVRVYVWQTISDGNINKRASCTIPALSWTTHIHVPQTILCVWLDGIDRLLFTPCVGSIELHIIMMLMCRCFSDYPKPTFRLTFRIYNIRIKKIIQRAGRPLLLPLVKDGRRRSSHEHKKLTTFHQHFLYKLSTSIVHSVDTHLSQSWITSKR